MAVLKTTNYHDEQSKQNILKLRAVLDTLPAFCKDFFRGIENYTSPRTRLAYAYDLRLFFEFLHENNSICAKTEITDYKISLLDQLCKDDIMEYLDYMALYQKDGKDITNDEKAKNVKFLPLEAFTITFMKTKKSVPILLHWFRCPNNTKKKSSVWSLMK